MLEISQPYIVISMNAFGQSTRMKRQNIDSSSHFMQVWKLKLNRDTSIQEGPQTNFPYSNFKPLPKIKYLF